MSYKPFECFFEFKILRTDHNITNYDVKLSDTIEYNIHRFCKNVVISPVVELESIKIIGRDVTSVTFIDDTTVVSILPYKEFKDAYSKFLLNLQSSNSELFENK